MTGHSAENVQELEVLLQDSELDESSSSEPECVRDKEGHDFRDREFEDLGESPSTTSWLRSRIRPPLKLVRRYISRHRHRIRPDVPATITFVSHSAVSVVVYCFLALLPRYLKRGGLQPGKKLQPTSYLDALRGYAALIVLNHHYFPWTQNAIIQWPFIRLIRSGRGMVDIFFVISGYVLSYRLLQLMRAKQEGPMLSAFASSFFRRYIRLYGSAAAAIFITVMVMWMGWGPLPPRDTFLEQIWDWAYDVGRFSNPFVDLPGYWTPDTFGSKYLVPLWTIPIEFRGSIFLYIFCIASCKLSVKGRMVFCVLLIVLCYYWAAIYAALFLEGLFLAELALTRHPERVNPSRAPTLPSNSGELAPGPRKQSLTVRLFYFSVIMIALFLVSQPNEDLLNEFWPWPHLYYAIPTKYLGSPVAEHWWLSIGSVMLIWALDSCPSMQTPLRWNFSQYLGHLSFGIYVMHIVVVWVVWIRFLDPWRIYLLGEEPWTFVPILLLNYAAVFWAADLFSKIDAKVVTFGRWLQDKVFDW